MLQLWTPFGLHRSASSFTNFDALFDALWRVDTVHRASWTALPPVRVSETDSDIVVTALVPGLALDDLGVTFDDGLLTLSGKRDVTPPTGYSVLAQERGSFSFERSFRFDSPIDADKVVARITDGLLTVTLPKHAPRRISVTVESA